MSGGTTIPISNIFIEENDRANNKIVIILSEEEIQLLDQVDFPQKKCINHLKPEEAHEDQIRAAWQNRK